MKSVSKGTFVLRLLALPKTIGMRKLRGYAASMGGSAEAFSDANSFAEAISDQDNTLPTIAIVDDRVNIKPEVLAEISKICWLIYVNSDSSENAESTVAEAPAVVVPHAPDILVSAYIQYPIQKFFGSAAIRTAINHICSQNEEFSLDCFMRWGAASSRWENSSKQSLSGNQNAFLEKYKLFDLLPESPQKLAVFLEEELPKIDWTCSTLQIRCDGLVFSSIARCTPAGNDKNLGAIVTKLKQQLSSVAVNTLADGSIEIATILPLNSDGTEIDNIDMTLIFNGRTLISEEREIEDLDTAV